MKWPRLGEILSTSPPCPLCGAKGRYDVGGIVNYDTLADQLAHEPAWLVSHGLSKDSGVPRAPDNPQNKDFYAAVRHPPVHGSSPDPDDVHVRCKGCATLLPPQFADPGLTGDFAITVAGQVGHGKTSWLLAILATPDSDEYEIVRHSDDLKTDCYKYAEPYTLDILKRGFRSPLYYQLFGTTLIYGEHDVTFIRTVDIKGEMFAGFTVKSPDEVILRHLGGGTGHGWLLVVDQFAGHSLPVQSANLQKIATSYESISAKLTTQQSGVKKVHKAIVWTFLDHAKWSPDIGPWLEKNVPGCGDLLMQVGATAGQPVTTLQPFVTFVDGDGIYELATALERTMDLFDATAFDAFTALLFRLQLLYTIRARNYVGPNSLLTKYEYLTSHGQPYVDACQSIARQIYARDKRSSMGGYVRGKRGMEWVVLPCGRFDDRSVWADQILIEAVLREP
jgi:hypothetical protein